MRKRSSAWTAISAGRPEQGRYHCWPAASPTAWGQHFYEPTLLTGLTREMRIFQEEIFGPVAAIMPFDTEEEAISLANDYLLRPCLLPLRARDLGRIWRVSEALQYGMVGINDVTLAAAETPFGGVKFSGMGREGSREGLNDYMETHLFLMGGIDN